MSLVIQRLQRELQLEKRYSPDQPRMPAGQSDGGQWTSGSGDGGGASTDINNLLQDVAYQGDFHDVVRDYVVKALRSAGNAVETEVSLLLPGPPPIEARTDILARGPLGTIYGVEVKTGENPTFTPNQQIVYPHAIGGAGVVSYDAKILNLGLVPGRSLPAFPINAVYARKGGDPLKVIPLPAEPR